jgi:hypothetical protein
MLEIATLLIESHLSIMHSLKHHKATILDDLMLMLRDLHSWLWMDLEKSRSAKK